MNNTEEKSWISRITDLGKIKTPYMVTDLSVIAQKAESFKELLPGIGTYYAVKSNNDPRVIKKLKPIVDGYDIASIGEFRLLCSLGVSPAKMLYSNPVKVPSHIDEAFKGGVSHFAIDSVVEVEKLKKYAPSSTVYLRIKVSDYGSKFPLSAKFGIDPQDAISCALAAKKANLQVKGLTFHVGSQAENSHVWEAALSTCGKLIKDLKSVGIEISFVDIGGGFPANYEDVAPTIKDAAKTINKSISDHIPAGVRVLAEPGRCISANASVIVSTVIGREVRGGNEWLYLDIGVFQGLIEVLEIGLKYPVFTKKTSQGNEKSFVLTGPSCDAHDTIGLDYMLPSDIKVGDQIYMGATGAYSMVYASGFNGFDAPKVVYTKTKRTLG